jgi:lipopolysaccharide export system protein LptA
MESGALTKFGDIASSRPVLALVVALTTVAGLAAAAQPQKSAGPPSKPSTTAQQQPSGPPNALQGFSQNRDKPVKINAAELEVHDKDKMAVFSGDVHLVQGDTDMRSSTLVVFYDDQPPPPAPPPKAGKGAPQASAQITPQQNQQIKRVEAKGNVIVVQKQKDQKDQTATGDSGIFDMRANTVTMVGNVVISQGDNILKGDNLTVNMTSGDATLTCGKDRKVPCRVTGLFDPSKMKQGPDGGGGLFPAAGRKP